jgi:general secretion pathway protein B
MSFILDALKKSESDRQRQSGPALFEVKVAPPKSGFPIWAIAIAALLVINMVIVGWMLLRRSSHGEDTAATNTPAASAGPTTPAAGAAPAEATNNTPTPIPPSVTGAAAQPTAPQFNTAAANGAPQPGNAPSANMSPAGKPPAASEQAQEPLPPSQQGMSTAEPRMPERDQNEPTLTGTPRESSGPSSESTANPDDYAPAAEPGSSLFKGHVKRGTDSGLTLYQDAALVSGSNLPQLRLDLHVYAAKPQDRFALINMHKMHEGDSLQGGVRVESITPDGVVMSHNGSKFLLPRE